MAEVRLPALIPHKNNNSETIRLGLPTRLIYICCNISQARSSDNNRKEWGAEHYTLIDFVAAICRHIPAVNAAKCNQFGTERRDGTEWFYFYRDIGATDCHVGA